MREGTPRRVSRVTEITRIVVGCTDVGVGRDNMTAYRKVEETVFSQRFCRRWPVRLASFSARSESVLIGMRGLREERKEERGTDP